MRTALGRLLEGALDLVFPHRCVGCQREGAPLCARCIASAPRLPQPCCPVCARPGYTQPCPRCGGAGTPVVDGIRAPFLMMQGAVREAVHHLKYNNLRALAPPMAAQMVAVLGREGWEPDLVVPVPLHPRRERQRGYNQAALLARGVSRLGNFPLAERVLERTRDTPPQVGTLSPEERFANVAGSFRCRVPAAGQRVLLVDDVCTTGATLSACARPLKEAGAARVWGLTFARAA